MTQVVRVTLSGTATVADVAAIAAEARDALTTGRPIILDVRGLARADTAIVQVAVALAGSVRATGVNLTVEGDIAPLVTAAAGSPDLAALLGVA